MATSGSWDSLGGRRMANLALVLRAEQWHQWGRSSIHPPHQHPDSFKGLDADSSDPAFLTSFEDKDRPAWFEFLAAPCNSKMLGWFSMGRLGTSGAIAFGGSLCRSGRKTYMFAIMRNRIEDLTCHRGKKVNAESRFSIPFGPSLNYSSRVVGECELFKHKLEVLGSFWDSALWLLFSSNRHLMCVSWTTHCCWKKTTRDF